MKQPEWSLHKYHSYPKFSSSWFNDLDEFITTFRVFHIRCIFKPYHHVRASSCLKLHLIEVPLDSVGGRMRSFMSGHSLSPTYAFGRIALKNVPLGILVKLWTISLFSMLSSDDLNNLWPSHFSRKGHKNHGFAQLLYSGMKVMKALLPVIWSTSQGLHETSSLFILNQSIHLFFIF